MTSQLLTNGSWLNPHALHLLHTNRHSLTELLYILLKHGAVFQHLSGRAVLEEVVIETSELLSYVLGAPPSWATVLHGKQLRAQVVKPQHVGVGVVVTPVVSDTHKDKKKSLGWSWVWVVKFIRKDEATACRQLATDIQFIIQKDSSYQKMYCNSNQLLWLSRLHIDFPRQSPINTSSVTCV